MITTATTSEAPESADRMPAHPSQTTDVFFDVRIESPSGTYNDYVYDGASRTLRLSAVVRPSRALPADFGAFIGTMGSDGGPIPALVLVSRPLHPGCLVSVRVIGAVETAPTSIAVIGVPAVDSEFNRIADPSDLSDDDQLALAHLVQQLANEREERTDGLRWLAAEEAVAAVREAQRAARVAAAANRKLSEAPSWQVLDPRLRAIRRTGEGEAYTEAEYSVADLPARFQRHVADCLHPDERLLHFVPRPETTLDSRLSFLRLRRLKAGLLVVTDRQVLWMTDALPPDSTLVDWGFLARSVPVERIQAAHLDESGPLPRLEIQAHATGGLSTLALEFPRSSLESCRHTVGLLSRFAPDPESRALLRLYEASAVNIDLALVTEIAGADTVRRLDSYAESELAGDEVLAKAVAPESSDRRRPPAILAVGRRRVVLVEDTQGGPALAGAWTYSEIVGVELLYSILGSSLRVVVPASGGRELVGLNSQSPGAFDPMLRTFRTMVPLIAGPTIKPTDSIGVEAGG